MSLSVKPLSAILDKNTDAIGKADPYTILSLGQQKHKGKPCKECGQKPTWSETFNFTNFKDTALHVEVWDKDTFTADDLIGTGTYDLRKVLGTPNTPFSDYVNLAIDGKPSGQILIEFKYTGPAIGQPTQPGQQGGQGNWGQPQQPGQQGGWGQQGGQQGGWGQTQGGQGQGGQGGWGQPQGGQQQGGWGQQGGQQQPQQGGWGQPPQNNQGKPPQNQGQGGWGQPQGGQQGGQGGSGGFVL